MNAEVYNLTHQFYLDYPVDIYNQILQKETRPYICFIIRTDKGYNICIPFRSNIRRTNAFLFSNTCRSAQNPSGLDYEKVILLKDDTYINTNSVAIVDNDEYIQAVSNQRRIQREVEQYIERYKKHITGEHVLHPREFERRYKYTTLKYFHDILGIS